MSQLKGKDLVVKYFDLFQPGFKAIPGQEYITECRCSWKGGGGSRVYEKS